MAEFPKITEKKSILGINNIYYMKLHSETINTNISTV